MELPREQQHGAINFIPKFSCSPLCRPAVRPDSDRTLALLLFLYFFGYKVAHNPTIFQTKSFLVQKLHLYFDILLTSDLSEV
jgi:hypothetical protein